MRRTEYTGICLHSSSSCWAGIQCMQRPPADQAFISGMKLCAGYSQDIMAVHPTIGTALLDSHIHPASQQGRSLAPVEASCQSGSIPTQWTNKMFEAKLAAPVSAIMVPI